MPGAQEEVTKCLLNKCHPVPRSRPSLQPQASPAHQMFCISEEPVGNSRHIVHVPGFIPELTLVQFSLYYRRLGRLPKNSTDASQL